MTTPFETYKLEEATKVVAERFEERARKAIAFYNGDHWQDGEGWIGPQFDSDHALYKPTMGAIERTFVSHNAVAEMVERHVEGVLARELHWKFSVGRELEPQPKLDANGQPVLDPLTQEPVMEEGKPTEEEEGLISEAEAALVEWWNDRNALETLKHALTGLLLVRRSPLRFSIPPGLRDEQGNLPTPKDLAQALDYLYLDHMGYDEDSLEQILPSATVHTDKNSRKQVGIFVYEDEETKEEKAELSFLDDEGFTVLRIIGGKPSQEELESAPFVRMQLGGRLTIHEMTRKALITTQIMSQQKSLNKTLTMKDRNDTQGGFLERYLLNVKWPTRKTINPATGEEEEVPEPLYTGPGTMNALQGSTYTDDLTGQTHVATPSVQFRDPVSAATFIESANHTYLGMLKEGNQLHHAMANEADVSGESRKQARDSYTKDLQSSANVIEGATRWVLETALAQASFLVGQAGRFEGLRAYVQAKIDPGPVTADDMRVAAEMLDRGLWDWETAVSATGVDDVDAIKQRLERDRTDNDLRMQAFQELAGEDSTEEEEDEEQEPSLANRQNGSR